MLFIEAHVLLKFKILIAIIVFISMHIMYNKSACRISRQPAYTFIYSAIGGPYAKWTLSIFGRGARPVRLDDVVSTS